MVGVIFSGPSLPRSLVEMIPGLKWQPPVKQGELYKAALNRPSVIGVVDGFFETVPTVWHKEILWAMTQGIHVYGAASIGALRAAELTPFGMKGIGRVFELFRDGTLQDDDEVAILHGPEELGYLPVTEAMVNVRATLERASSERVIESMVAKELQFIAKSIFYKNRTYDTIFEAATERGIQGNQIRCLEAWLPLGRVDQKRLDGVAMLDRIRQDLSANLHPMETTYRFAHTSAWEDAVRSAHDGED